VHQDPTRYTVRGWQMSNGWGHTGFPWNHFGTAQPDDPAGSPCLAADKALRFWKYNDADTSNTTTRMQSTADTTDNTWGWNDLPCSTPLPYICVWSCEWPLAGSVLIALLAVLQWVHCVR
jgi:hypothetical protein